MREPQRNKAERFPRREGNKLVTCRDMTPEEASARREEKLLLKKARELRRRKLRESNGR